MSTDKDIGSLSLEKASFLQKHNCILDQAISHIRSFDKPNGGNIFLESEGVLRLSGSKEKIEAHYKKMVSDPNAATFTSNDLLIKDDNNIVGIVKMTLKEISVPWSEGARKAFSTFVDNPKMSYEELVEQIAKEGSLEEAKALHNILYLCHEVCAHSDNNKMIASNIQIAIGPSIAIFLKQRVPLDPAGQMNIYSEEQLKSGLARFTNAISKENPYFSKTFSEMNPEMAANLRDEYIKKFPPISSNRGLSPF